MYIFLADKYQKYFFYTVVVITIGFLLYPSYPPLTDLPQHASQVVTFDDWLKGRTTWNSIIQINLDTPYLMCYAIWLFLYQFFDIVLSSKIVICIIFLSYLYMIRLLRLAFNLDRTFDWVALTCFFGFAFQWGFMSFLIGIPIGLLFLIINKRWIESQNNRYLYYLTLVGILSYLSHLLTFAFFCFISYAYFLTAISGKISWRKRWLFTIPYLLFAILLSRILLKPDPIGLPTTQYHNEIIQDTLIFKTQAMLYYPWHMTRLVDYAPVAIMIYLAPILLGYQLTKDYSRYVLLLATLLVWYILPHTIFEIAYIYQRFALFIPIFYYLLWERPSPPIGLRYSISQIGEIFFILSLSILLYSLYNNNFRFNSTVAIKDFQRIEEQMLSKKRVMYIVEREAMSEDTITSVRTYLHFAQWYQAQKHGWVDYSFASTPAMIVRLKPSQYGLYKNYGSNRVLEQQALTNNTDCHIYDYLLIHTKVTTASQVSNWLRQNSNCQHMKITSQAKDWLLFAKRDS